ncbi:hypothetical protein AABB24_032694, partial [Solanum stoloniferum]
MMAIKLMKRLTWTDLLRFVSKSIKYLPECVVSPRRERRGVLALLLPGCSRRKREEQRRPASRLSSPELLLSVSRHRCLLVADCSRRSIAGEERKSSKACCWRREEQRERERSKSANGRMLSIVRRRRGRLWEADEEEERGEGCGYSSLEKRGRMRIGFGVFCYIKIEILGRF